MSVKMNEEVSSRFDEAVMKICNLSSIEQTEKKLDRAYGFLVRSNEYFVPMSGDVDIAAETDKLKEELKYTQGFLNSVQKKLSNERFVSGAPEQVVANERKKAADAEAKIKILKEKLESLNWDRFQMNWQ